VFFGLTLILSHLTSKSFGPESIRSFPSWNIKGSAWRVRWAGDLHHHPQPSAYSAPDTPTSQCVTMVKGGGATGDPEKAAAALIKLSHIPANELPARIQFGSDSWAIVKSRAEVTVRDAEKWSEVSHSTNKDGVSKEAIVKFMASMIQ
jgi:hypothetical protein